jgi:hypothetical protein
VIRLVTLDPYDPKVVDRLCKVLYTAFGVGCEHAGDMAPPAGQSEPFDVEALLHALPSPRAYTDDKVLYLTQRKLKPRSLISGELPTSGFALQNGPRALVSSAGVKDLEAGLKIIARHAMHQLGHTWELHHCLDPRCAMYPPWTLNFDAGDTFFETFCRDKSEQKIRLAKS